MTGRRRAVRAGIAGLLVVAALPSSASANVKISQVYGAGGFAGATYTHDFVELRNVTANPVSLAGWAVQYASPTGTGWLVTNLSGSIPANGYYLVQLASNAAIGSALPTPDTVGTTNMGGSAGKVALTNTTTALSDSCPIAPVVDLVGYGATANCFEGSGPADAPSATLADLRRDAGCTDTNANNTDFTTATPAPRNSSTTTTGCATIGSVLISEVEADPAGGPVPEWFELTNVSPSAIAIDGWTITDNATTATLPNTIIPAGAQAIFTGDSVAFAANHPAGTRCPVVQVASFPALSNTGDQLRLAFTTTGFDAMSYGTNTTHLNPAPPVPTAGTTATLQRVPTTTNTGTAADWQALTESPCDLNTPPVLDPIGPKSVAEGQQLQFTISATDINGDALTYSASNLPSGATFNAGTRTLTWTPSSTQAGSYPNVHFQVTDGIATDAEDIAITVTDVNEAPVLGSIGDKTIAEGSQLQFAVSATDPNPNDTLTLTAFNLPPGSAFDPGTRTFTWTPDPSQAGIYSGVRFQVGDGVFTDFEDVAITVTDTPDGGGGGGGGGTVKAATTTSVNGKTKGEKVKVNGTVLPAQAGGPVKLTLLRSKRRGAPMKPVRSATATLDTAGAFAAKLKRKPEGKCQVRAEWAGDADSLPSSATDGFRC